MDGISSTPAVQFLRPRDKYKSDLLDDSGLTKAADLAAQQELLLERPAPDTWKEPCLQSVNRQLWQWTKKIRQPGGICSIGGNDSEEDNDENNLVVGPMQQFMGDIRKIQKSIKRQATTPNIPQTRVTPAIKQSPNMVFNPRQKSTWVLNSQLDPLTLNYSTQLSTSHFNIQS